MPGGRCKSLFLKIVQEKALSGLWSCWAEDRVDTGALQKNCVGASRLSLARPDLMRSVLGVEAGLSNTFAVIGATAQDGPRWFCNVA